MTIEAHIQAQARELANAWVLKNIAHGGAIDVCEVADSDWDAGGMLSEAVAQDASILAFVNAHTNGEAALLAAFAGFIRFCVAQADAIEA